jgi:DNA-binding IclR family transcriptional regulator
VSATPPASPGAAAAGAVAGQAAHALALVFEGEPRTLAELAEAIGVSEPDAAALVAGLERHELIASDSTGSSFRAGPAALRFARVGALREDLLELAVPALERLARESGETANLIVPRAAGTEAIAQVDGRHLLGTTNWLGRELPLHCTAAGKVFLAQGVAELGDGPLSAPAPATITDRDQLRRELDAIREQGYATLVDELEDGLSAVGAPVRAGGSVIAALTVSGATVRLPPARLALLGRLALEQARAVSAALVHGTAEL